MSFFWYQRTGGEELWHEALSEHRDSIVATKRPAFVTVLDADQAPDVDTWGAAEYEKLRYSGPLYFDFDAEDLNQTIPAFQAFLSTLEETHGVNLGALRLFATGGRGFHIEVPQQIFMAKVPSNGTLHLPYIYREIALEFAVDTLDLRVYTGRRGRMWRVPGVQRSNGNYKVPITPDQARKMTVEMYAELCAIEPLFDKHGQRLLAPEEGCVAVLPVDPPELSTSLAAMFIKASQKIAGAVKARAKSQGDAKMLARFNGEYPPSVAKIMRGEGLAPTANFHQIALQLAITANALGKSEKEFLESCEGLIKTHKGDSQRYNSPRKKRDALARLWAYTHGNDCYSYSNAAVRALTDVDQATPDLESNSDGGLAGHVPDNDGDEEGEDASEVAAVADELSVADRKIFKGMFIASTGMYRKSEDGVEPLSNLSFSKPSVLIDTESGTNIGFEVGVRVDGKHKGRKSIDTKEFGSRAALNNFCAGLGATFVGTDAQASLFNVMLTRAAEKAKRVIYMVRREGLDLIQNPVNVTDREYDVIWASEDGVWQNNKDVQYQLRPRTTHTPLFRSDIYNAPELTNTPDSLEWLRSVIRMNNPLVIAQMFGWFVSCLHKQFYQAAYTQFPLLHPTGSAGSGKTLTSSLFAQLYHNLSKPAIISAAKGATTRFAFKGYWTGSASIPFLLEEYKPAEMGPDLHDFFLTHFRMLYNQASGSSGGMNSAGANGSFRDVTNYEYSAPTVYMAESQEMQTAVMQRSLAVSFMQSEASPRKKFFEQASAGSKFMPQLGRLLLGLTLANESVDTRRAALQPHIDTLRAQLPAAVHDRQVYNIAVVLAGLDFLDQSLQALYGDALRDDMEMLKQALHDGRTDLSAVAISEPAKVLNDMALMSHTEDSESEFALREGTEYVVTDGGLELLVREAYIKYNAWTLRKGFRPLYSSPGAFQAAIGRFAPTVDRQCISSPLREGRSGVTVFRFSLEKLQCEGVELFKTKS